MTIVSIDCNRVSPFFGYGSLCWNPGFEFDQTLTGHVKGYSRKFWQGNTTHRGVEGKPGRVATIIEDSRDVVWGRAFRLVGEAALRYLEKRECLLGGYKTIIGNFHPRHDVPGLTSFPVLIYVATPDNHLWLGDASIADIANQIVDCRGASGHNVEYLLKLARFMREHIPEADKGDTRLQRASDTGRRFTQSSRDWENPGAHWLTFTGGPFFGRKSKDLLEILFFCA